MTDTEHLSAGHSLRQRREQLLYGVRRDSFVKKVMAIIVRVAGRSIRADGIGSYKTQTMWCMLPKGADECYSAVSIAGQVYKRTGRSEYPERTIRVDGKVSRQTTSRVSVEHENASA